MLYSMMSSVLEKIIIVILLVMLNNSANLAISPANCGNSVSAFLTQEETTLFEEGDNIATPGQWDQILDWMSVI